MNKNCKPYPRFRNLVKSAARRSVDVLIDIDDWKRIMEGFKCSYCGSDISKETGGGLDRINNDIGYVEGNLKPCCKICNNMKGCLSEEEFKLHILKISKNI